MSVSCMNQFVSSRFVSEALCVSVKKPAGPEISCSFSKYPGSNQDPAPIISVPAQRRLSHNGLSTSGREESDTDAASSSFTDQPVFFRWGSRKDLHYVFFFFANNFSWSRFLFIITMFLLCLFSNREFRFTSEVPIRLDYHGKHVSMEQVKAPSKWVDLRVKLCSLNVETLMLLLLLLFQGTFAGIVIGLTQLNCSELKLRRLCYRQGYVWHQ